MSAEQVEAQPVADITISHTPEDGTVVDGDPRPHHGLVKAQGFKYSRNVGWYVPGSRGRAPRTHAIEAVRAALEEVGFTVAVSIEVGTAAERAAAREASIAARQAALDAKAERKEDEAEVTLARARQMAGAIPFGQPILVGHHSEGADRRYRARIHRTYDKGFEAASAAEEAARKAEASRGSEAWRKNGRAIVKRIGRLEVELRDLDRKLGNAPKTPQMVADEVATGTSVTAPETGSWRERLADRRAYVADEIELARTKLAESGYVLTGPDDYRRGDRVRVSAYQWGTVERVNAKSLTVRPDSSSYRTVPVPYEDVYEKQGPVQPVVVEIDPETEHDYAAFDPEAADPTDPTACRWCGQPPDGDRHAGDPFALMAALGGGQ